MLLAGGGSLKVEDVEPTLAPVKEMVATPVAETVNKVVSGGFEWSWLAYGIGFLVVLFIIWFFWLRKK